MNTKVVALGEVLLRLSPPANQRFTQARSFDLMFAGAEANVLVSLAQFGLQTSLVSRVPEHDLGTACLNQLRTYGVGTENILRGGSRLGIYFLESGSSQRASSVIYDRQHSAISEIDPGSLDWPTIFQGASWFHITGITPALSSAAEQATREGAQMARKLGITVSCDLNYRAKLWGRDRARKTLDELMAHVDVCVGLEPLFDFKRETNEAKNRDKLEAAVETFKAHYGLSSVGMSLRQQHSASRNGWAGLCSINGKSYWSRPYEIDVLDRVGTGDAFTAGFLYGLIQKMAPQDVVEFATAASCLKHTISGDFNLVSTSEVEHLMKGNHHGRIQR